MSEDHIHPEPDQPTLSSEGDDKSRVVCPRCYRATDSLKCVSVPVVLYILVYFVWSYETVVACPTCLRRHLLHRTLLAVPAANLLFPLVALVYAGEFLVTCVRGHTDSALAEAARLTPEAHLALQQESVNLRKRPRREAVVLGVIVLLIAALWGGAFLWKHLHRGGAPVQREPIAPWLRQVR